MNIKKLFNGIGVWAFLCGMFCVFTMDAIIKDDLLRVVMNVIIIIVMCFI